MTRLGLLFALGLGACQGPAPERFTSDEDGFSIRSLGGDWAMSRERGSLVFRGPADSERARTTIAIRSVPMDGDQSARGVLDATSEVLAALPSAEVHGPYHTDHKRFDATAFDLTFTPKSKGVPYARRHVVLTGSGRHVYHLMLTAPAGELERSAALFDDIVGSLKGEG